MKARFIMISKRFSHDSDRGTTILEFLIASAMGVALMGMSMSVFLVNRRVLKNDLERAAVQQNLRSSLDIIGINVRLAGENLPSSFPAIEVIDGGVGNDQLILRRNLRDEILKLCTALGSGSTDPLVFGTAGTTPGCVYGDQTTNYTSWNDHLADEGGEALGYIYDPTSQVGQFFTFDSVIDDPGNEYSLSLASGSWTNNYPVGLTSAYILEDWRFERNGDLLQLFEDGDSANPLNVIYGIESFEVQVTLQDGTTVSSFAATDDWTEVQTIDVTLTAQEGVLGKSKDRTVTAKFFPRNVLSN